MIKKKITNQSERIVVVNKYHSNYDFYIGRGSVLGNPYPITDIDSRDSVCDKYEVWFEQNKDRPDVKEYLNKILAKARLGSVSLGCFCKPQRCHGDTIKQWLDQQLGVSVMKSLNDTQTLDMFERKYTPENITELKSNEIFVFGSNTQGRHGKGASKLAMQFGAMYGLSQGHQGYTYAIVTKDLTSQNKYPLHWIKEGIIKFLRDANETPVFTYLVTKIGCGLGGYTANEIANLFIGLDIPSNVLLPKEFWEVIESKTNPSYTYCGIGSRETPVAVMKVMTEIAQLLEKSGYRLYSGAAEGADSAFAWNTANKIEFIPWNGFNGCKSGVIATSDKAMKLAESLHPAWDRLSQGAKKLMARNCHQILGEDLNSPVDFVLCWTPDGAETSTTSVTFTEGVPVGCVVEFDTL